MPLIVIYGLDGATKQTQAALAASAAIAAGHDTVMYDFPNYHSSFGKCIEAFLRGKFDLSPYELSEIFAADRAEVQAALMQQLDAGVIAIANRYVGCNEAYQAARIWAEGKTARKALYEHIRALEYGRHKMPRPDLILFLDWPLERIAQHLAARGGRDRNEIDTAYLGTVARAYEEIRQLYYDGDPSWITIDCGSLDTREAIHGEIMRHLTRYIGKKAA